MKFTATNKSKWPKQLREGIMAEGSTLPDHTSWWVFSPLHIKQDGRSHVEVNGKEQRAQKSVRWNWWPPTKVQELRKLVTGSIREELRDTSLGNDFQTWDSKHVQVMGDSPHSPAVQMQASGKMLFLAGIEWQVVAVTSYLVFQRPEITSSLIGGIMAWKELIPL